MTRYLLCESCGETLKLHSEDVEMGFHLRKVNGNANRPDGLAIIVKSGDDLEHLTKEKRIDVPVLLCDRCNAELPNGTAVVAATIWRGREPSSWESEYLAA